MIVTQYLTKDRGLATLALLSICSIGILKFRGKGIRGGVLTPGVEEENKEISSTQGESYYYNNRPAERDFARKYRRASSKDLNYRQQFPSVTPGLFLRDFYNYHNLYLLEIDTQLFFNFLLFFIYKFFLAVYFSI